MLWLVCLFNYADRQTISSLFPLLKQEFGFNKAQLGLIGSSFMWVYAASAPIAGFAGDRRSRKGLILGGCILWSLLTVVTGICSRLWQFVASRALIGLGESVYFPSAISLLSNLHGAGTRSTALSIHQSAVYIGTIAGGGWEHFLPNTMDGDGLFTVLASLGSSSPLFSGFSCVNPDGVTRNPVKSKLRFSHNGAS